MLQLSLRLLRHSVGNTRNRYLSRGIVDSRRYPSLRAASTFAALPSVASIVLVSYSIWLHSASHKADVFNASTLSTHLRPCISDPPLTLALIHKRSRSLDVEICNVELSTALSRSGKRLCNFHRFLQLSTGVPAVPHLSVRLTGTSGLHR